jgi:hypothetical protein
MFGFFNKKQPSNPPPPPLPAEPPRAIAPNHFDLPQNAFEHQILAFHRKQIGIQQFLASFFNAQVVVLSDHQQFDFAGGQASLVQTPKLFAIKAPTFNFVAVYSHTLRADPVYAKHPDMRFASQALGGELLLALDPAAGVVINPGWDINFHWEPQQVEAVRKTIRE